MCNIDNYISSNKKTINLPVPLGTELYRIVTTCGDFCLHQKELFDEFFPKTKNGVCNNKLSCHTRLHNIQPIEFNINNLASVLEDYGTFVFSSYEEANEEANRIILKNRKAIKRLGFEIDESGYSTVKG